MLKTTLFTNEVFCTPHCGQHTPRFLILLLSANVCVCVCLCVCVCMSGRMRECVCVCVVALKVALCDDEHVTTFVR